METAAANDGKTASRAYIARPADIKDTLSLPTALQTRQRMSRQPGFGMSLGRRASRPRARPTRSLLVGCSGVLLMVLMRMCSNNQTQIENCPVRNVHRHTGYKAGASRY